MTEPLLPFPRLEPSRQVRPESTSPRLWLRRLQILQELAPGVEHVVRDVPFRCGLNIICTPPTESSEASRLFEDGMAGHTAGKTTLCRLIRYVLGEATFANEAVRLRIREAFPKGWVVGEVMVAGVCWTVARPLGHRARAFCLRDAPLNAVHSEHPRHDLDAFTAAIDAACTGSLPAKRFPTREEAVTWAHLLPWLTRDQECRFSDLLAWRHPTSDAKSPGLSADEQQFVIRSVLGLIRDDEREEQKRNARLLSKKKSAETRLPLVDHQASVDHGRVQACLGSEVRAPSDGLFGMDARNALGERRQRLQDRLRALVTLDGRSPLQQALEDAITTEANAKRDHEDAVKRRDLEKACFQKLEARSRGEQQAQLLTMLPPAAGFCSVPIGYARERGCPLAVSAPYDLGAQRAQRTAAEEIEVLKGVVRGLEERVSSCVTARDAASTAVQGARTALKSASDAHDARIAAVQKDLAVLEQVEQQVDHAERAARDAASLTAAVADLERQIKASYEMQEALRRATSEALARLSRRFDYVLRALVGDGVSGFVEASGRSLRLKATEHGDRESAAIGTVKLLAFDLAALTEGVEGRGAHPCFLVHDGPREADMSPSIYQRLFLYARSLEEACEGEAGFQYIVTTTTPPPKDLQREPWLRLTLRGTPAEERLLGRDL